MQDLDNAATLAELDPAGMRERMRELPRQCADAWAMTRRLSLPEGWRDVRRVVILGMGGSAIGGALLAGLATEECSVPVYPVGGYDLPAHVGPDSLVIGSSYSGDTEETLSAFAQAAERGCRLIAVTTGGKLAEAARERDAVLIRFDYHSPPRAAVGYSFTLLLGLLCRLRLLRDHEADLEEAVAVMESWQREWSPEVPVAGNVAKQMALALVGRLPVVYGAGFLAPVARRWKGQFNENSKIWSFWEELPELDHNAVLGYGLPEAIRERISVLMLRSPHDPPRVQVRWEVTGELLSQAGVGINPVWGKGDSRLAQMFSLVHLGDYVSLYLAVLNGVDPSEMSAVAYLKRRLAEVG